MGPGPSVGLPLPSLCPSCLQHPQSRSTEPEVVTTSLAPGWDGCSVGTIPELQELLILRLTELLRFQVGLGSPPARLCLCP